MARCMKLLVTSPAQQLSATERFQEETENTSLWAMLRRFCDFGAMTHVLRVAYIVTSCFTLPSDDRCCGIGAKFPSDHPVMPARDHEVSVFGVYCSTLVLMIYKYH